MKALNRGTVVNVRSLVMKAAHAQAKVWVGLDCICFDSYSQALSYALKKAWAAVKGESLVFSWEPTGSVAVSAISELLTPKVTEVAVKQFVVDSVVGSDRAQSTGEQFSNFQDLLKEKGINHLKSNVGFAVNIEGKPFSDTELRGLGEAFLVVAYLVDYGSFSITTYFYAKSF